MWPGRHGERAPPAPPSSRSRWPALCRMWLPLPLAWVWIGAQAFGLTGSLLAGGGVALLGFLATTLLVMKGLARIDTAWVGLRRQSGHAQAKGALTQVVVVSATLGLLLF